MRRFAFAAVAALVASTACASASTPAAKPPKLIAWCDTSGVRNAAVRLRAADGARLVGVLLGPADAPAGVVLSHEGSGGLCNWLAYGRQLARLGYRVLVYDARGVASSPRPRARSGRWDLDVRGAAAELRRRGVRSVVLAGGSLGAMSSLVAASEIEPPVDGVVAVSPGLAFRAIDAASAVPRLRVPVLYIVGEEDDEFPQFARQLYDATAAEHKRLVVVSGRGHGFELLGRSADPRAREAFEAFLAERTGR